MPKKSKTPHKKLKTKKSGGNKSSHLPPVCVLQITQINEEGELVAIPIKWDPRKTPPYIIVTESGRSTAAAVGDRVLAKLKRIRPQLYQALVIRLLASEEPKAVIGMLVMTGKDGIIEPISRKNKESYMVAHADLNGAQNGELVAGVTTPGTPSMSMTYAKVTERLGSLGSPKAASLIATHMYELPTSFSKEALRDAEQALPPTQPSPSRGEGKGRVDLREIPLITIDGEDARDFDDAVYATPDGKGFRLTVAIADVAHYVQEDSALDHDAYTRGNSVYFPDRVIPMLPERLSNGLCSLKPNEDRYCLAVHMNINEEGEVKKYEFVRGIMRSRARLTYTEVEEVMSHGSRVKRKSENKDSRPMTHDLITHLYAAYAALAKERDARGALDLNLPEYQICFDASGNVSQIAAKKRLASHQLIECFMIAANVCAADFLLKNKMPGIYRVHDQPSEEKLEDLRNMLSASGYKLGKGTLNPAQFNYVLRKSEGKPEQFMIHTSVLRSQMQAYYAATNTGHFGLGLEKYCHFTSPIRRYADLVVHRALTRLITDDRKQMTEKNRSSVIGHLADISLHISDTERKAMMAERDAADRYKVSYMARHIGNVFSGTICGLNEHGIFVALSDNGVQGFIPVRHLGNDFFLYDKRHACFKGQRSKKRFALGDAMLVRVAEANAMTGSLLFSPSDVTPTPRPHMNNRAGKPGKGKKDDKSHKGGKRKKKR